MHVCVTVSRLFQFQSLQEGDVLHNMGGYSQFRTLYADEGQSFFCDGDANSAVFQSHGNSVTHENKAETVECL